MEDSQNTPETPAETEVDEELDALLKHEVKETADEARKQFSLEDRLKNRGLRTKKITVFSDEASGEALQTIESALDALEAGILTLDDGPDKDAQQKTHDDLAGQADEIRAELLKTSFSFELRALPPVILKGVQRKTRKTLGITDKSIPAEREEDYNDAFRLQLIADQAVRFVDREDPGRTSLPTVQELAAMRDFLPMNQWAKVWLAADDIQFRNVISESAVESADF